MKETTQVCSHCRQEHCDGVVYITIEKYPRYLESHDDVFFQGCSSSPEVEEHHGKKYYRHIIGHGMSDLYPMKKK